MPRFAGLTQVVVTPFAPDGALDEASLRRLVRSVVAEGAAALTPLGVSSEALYLDEDERRRVLQITLEEAGDARVLPGVSSHEAGIAARRAAEASQLGCAGAMVAPPPRLEDLTTHLAAVAGAAGDLPLVLQDFPPTGHPRLTPQAIAEVAQAVGSIAAVYHEDAPTLPKIAALTEVAPDLEQLGGLGALWAPWELRLGAVGLITGFAFPRLVAGIIAAALRGDWAQADRLHRVALPAIVWEAQPMIGPALRKAVLVERGIIACGRVRVPVPRLDWLADDARRIVAATAGPEAS